MEIHSRSAFPHIGQENTEEFVVETKAGQRLIVDVAASNGTSSSGKLGGRMASFVDITKRKEVEADREDLITKLQDALAKIRALRGIILLTDHRFTLFRKKTLYSDLIDRGEPV
jgi:signal transduction histidine kinase